MQGVLVLVAASVLFLLWLGFLTVVTKLLLG